VSDAGCAGDACSVDGGSLCASGFQSLPDGVGCDPIVPSDVCPAGTMATLGSTHCVPVGFNQCPAGFADDPSGWGCTGVLPTAACAGTTMEVLGQTACQAVGDCAAPFPPGTATLFVSPTGTLDATHFQTIGAAIASASPGAIIAVDSGTYVESLVVSSSLSLVGRCAAQVVVQSPATEAAGLDVLGSGTVFSMTGFTFQGHRPGVVFEMGSHATLAADVLDGNQDIGLLVQNSGTTANVTGTVIRGTQNPGGDAFGWGAYASLGGALTMVSSAVVGNLEFGVTLTDPNSTASLTSVVVRNTQPGASGLCNAVGVQPQTQLTVASSAILGNVGAALAITGPSASAKVTTSSLTDTSSLPSGTAGNGISIISGGELTIDSSWMARNSEVALSIDGAGTKVTANQVSIVDTQPNGQGQFGAGVGVTSGATLTMSQSAVVNSIYYGIFLSDMNSSAEINQSLVDGTALDRVDMVGRDVDVQNGAKAVLLGTTTTNAQGETLLVSGLNAPASLSVTSGLAMGGHIGAFVQLGGELELNQSAILGSIEAGLYLTADDGAAGTHSQATATDTVIRGIQPINGTNGAGVVSGGVATLTNVTVNDIFGYGVLAANNSGADGGLTTSGSTMSLMGCVVRGAKAEPVDNSFGHGVIGLNLTLVTLVGCAVTDNVGIGVAFQSGTGLVQTSTISNNAVGIHVQGSSTLVQLDSPPAKLSAGEVVVTTDSTFLNDQVNSSSNTVPLPSSPLSQ
jgi:hypothetical protein